jgi:hypothetical protein
MYLGWAAAALCGLGMPSFVFLMGDVLNSFDKNTTSGTSMMD